MRQGQVMLAAKTAAVQETAPKGKASLTSCRADTVTPTVTAMAASTYVCCGYQLCPALCCCCLELCLLCLLLYCLQLLLC
jgi:hypothetical protein